MKKIIFALIIFYLGIIVKNVYSEEIFFKILSKNQNIHRTGQPLSYEWKVVLEKKNNEEYIFNFYAENQNNAPFGKLTLLKKQTMPFIAWQDTMRTVNGTKGLLYLPSCPAPCNMLYIDPKISNEVYDIENEAGGRKFIQHYSLIQSKIELAQVKENGWLKILIPSNSELKLVRLINDLNQEVIKQVWSSEGNWWLYEETENRQSWLVY